MIQTHLSIRHFIDAKYLLMQPYQKEDYIWILR